MKKCITCRNEKPLAAFCKDKSTHDGLAKRCRECYANAKSKYKKQRIRGVDKLTEKCWRARIMHNGLVINLGYFDNSIDAAKAYNAYVLEHNLPKWRLNDIYKAESEAR